MARLIKQNQDKGDFDRDFWLKIGHEGRFSAAWDMVYEVDLIRGKHYVATDGDIPGHYEFNGLYGGCTFFHPYRKKHSDDGTSCEFNLHCDRHHTWEVGPHFHFVGYGKMDEKSDEFYTRTGWVYKNLGKRESTYETIKYLLTHVKGNLEKNIHLTTEIIVESTIKEIIKRETELFILALPVVVT